ncbi:MAG TPA: DMT family transporter [Dongiaceae bacterium]|nr:DMT family transporter [Dongiaceae bacterium]
MPSQTRPFLVTAGLLVGAILSGVTWIPLRVIEHQGVIGLWITLAVVTVAAVPLLPALLKARGLARRDQLGLIWIAAFIGVDYAFYTASLTTTQVSRAILLFYMAPVWGTLLEVFALRQPLTLRRASALILGGAGLIAIFGIGLDLQLSLNVGDVLALLSGILWSIGLLFVLRHRAVGPGIQSGAVALGALVGGIAIVVLLESAPPPSLAVLASASPWVLVTGIGFILPVWVVSMWAGRIMSPARMTLIFMAEVCFGVGSAALWADQPFGLRETIGTILVLAAAAVELGGSQGAALSPQGVSRT